MYLVTTGGWQRWEEINTREHEIFPAQTEKNKAGSGSCLEEFHLLKASSGIGGSEPANETLRESNIKEENRKMK